MSALAALAAVLVLAGNMGLGGSPAHAASVDPDKVISGLTLESGTPGTLEIGWDEPADKPQDYRVIWAKTDEKFSSWRSTTGNAFPTTNSLTVTGLEEGAEYKVRVRARYDGSRNGPWTAKQNWTHVIASSDPASSEQGDEDDPVGGRVEGRDIDLHACRESVAPVVDEPRGAFGSGSTLWVSDVSRATLFAFSVGDGDGFGSRAAGSDISVSGVWSPRGIWADAVTMYVANYVLNDNGFEIGAYALSDGGRDADKSFDLVSENFDPRGIWSDGTTMWVVDTADDRVYAYTLSSGARDASKEFALDAATEAATDVYSDGTTIWVSDYGSDRVYAYTIAAGDSFGQRDSSKGFDTHPDNDLPYAIWSDGTTMWVADVNDDKMYAYNLADASGGRVEGRDIDLHACRESVAPVVDEPRGAFGSGSTLWVSDVSRATLFAFSVGDGDGFGSRAAGSDISVSGVWSPRGIWADAVTMYVANYVLNDNGFEIGAYALSDGGRDADKSFDLVSENFDPRGIWSDGTTMWVVDTADDRVYAYTLSSGARDASKEFALDAATEAATDVYSDGTTIWVSDYGSDRVYAYTIAAGDSFGQRDSSKGFDTHPDNDLPYAIWSDGTTMWVADVNDDKMYAYNLADAHS